MINAIGRQPIKEEFLNIKLGDKRLTQRLVHLAELFDGKFESNIPHACGAWKEIVAAYRFFSNPRIDPERIQDTHISNTVSRMNDLGQSPMLVIQDTTMFNYESHNATRNLGSIGRVHGKHVSGIHCHTAMAYSVHGTPLGILFQKFWLRIKRSKTSRAHRRSRHHRIPLEKKESFRWSQVIGVTSLVQQRIQKRLIVVADQEGDINEVFRMALELKVGFTIRVNKTRTCKEAGKLSVEKYLKKGPFLGIMKIDVIYRETIPSARYETRRLSPAHRKAIVQVWWQQVTIKVRDRSTRKYVEKKVTAILVDEKLKPHQHRKEKLSWLLFTDECINSWADATRVIKYYKCRWSIEDYHKVYKAGCKVQDCRLGYGPRLIKYLTVMAVIAWRQHYLTEIGRQYSGHPASLCLSSQELQTLKIEFKNISTSELTLGQAWRLIAQLGGFMNRKSNKYPGPTTLWRGLQELFYITRGVEEASTQSKQSINTPTKAA